MIGDGEELRIDWRRGGAAAAGLVAALVLMTMVVLVALSNGSREQALAAERHAYDVALVARNVSSSTSRAETTLARYVLDQNETTGRIYYDQWQRAGYQTDQRGKLGSAEPDQR